MKFEKAMMEFMKSRNLKTPPTKEESYKMLVEVMVKQHDLEGIDIEKEFELIQKKESRLSRSKRDAISQIIVLKKIQNDVLKQMKEEEEKKKPGIDASGHEAVEALKEAEVTHTPGEEVPSEVIEAEVKEESEKLPPPPAEIEIK